MENNLQSIILYGHKGCGKTYYGRLLSKKIHCNHVDTDLLIEDYFKKTHSTRLTCREILIKHGEIYFRSLENQVVSTLFPQMNCIISVGGGTVLNNENLIKLQTLGQLVYLKTDLSILKNRFLQSTFPSHLDFDQSYEKRTQIYEKISSTVIETSHQNEESILQILINLIRK